ncbi:hypothetical protein PVAP13_8KG228400 [Panicum virgatum]|uniref:Protein kinase domain-containing protein n=1 Tax=Panicum virgatum TaxID=38727 RepID=A0A8T0PRG2_PANVG|nr:hypothetical protein PVAP13_8KG228400 [Panicum virgatum]
MELEDISFQFLREITDGFSEERILGEGAFGVVYKGVTKNGDDVAVKIFKLPNINVNHDLKQFQNEFYNLTKLKHENIVQILGYCYEIEKKPFIMDGSKLFVDETHIALCFEYLHNGSLQKHLSDGFYELDWHTRFKIIKGICVGLKYIHDELQEPIYHLDLKPDNILLDKEMVPKIADFGLSRIFSNELARITQNPYGTRGYQPPEYIDKGEISGKFDIFSLGVVIIKIVSGPEGYPKCLDISTDEFIDQIQRDWRSRLEATCTGDLLEAYCHQVETCTQIALKCVVTDSQKRPDIVKINEKLNELEIDIDKVHKKGCLRHVSKMTMHNSKIEMRTESKDIIDPHQNIILWSHPSCNELELHDALETPSHVIEEHIVGRTEEKEKVMASLHEVISERIVILPIHGIGGIGKTTFARLIYNEPKFRCYSQTSEAYYEQATFFTMHDLVHDLAISLLGNQILDQSKQSNTGGSSCQYALLRDCSRPLEYCLTSHARLVALRFLEGCRSKLSGAAFAPARSLRVLDLSECSIQRLPDSIGQLKQLRYLNAPKIQKEFVPECITELSNLIYLNLQGSRISCLPESIGELERLMHLDLSYCSNLKLPNSFRNLEKLVHLDLSYCRSISGVLESLQCLSRLEHLNLSSCRKIGDVTRVMIGLTELQYLNLSEVPCVGLQQVLVNLTKLRYLNLEGSLGDGLDEDEIGSLLECVGSLSNLEYLNLGRNDDLRTIPESIGNLRKLNTLDLLHCKKLQMLPASVSAINTLKFLHVYGCRKLDKSTLPQNKNSTTVLLPHFVVHAGDGESSSNISELEDKHPTFLEISRLENAKSAEEAKRIKLVEKQSIEKLELAWTRDAMRFADDREVLSGLVPPDTLGRLTLEGYNSISFPSWLMSIATYLPRLRNVTLRDLPSCNVLPPLGQLPILGSLSIRGMDSIRKIDGGFYGGRRAFPKLVYFSLSHMECLEEWNATYSSDVDDLNELAFPKLRLLSINRCPLLRFNACTPPGITVIIDSSDQALLSQWENRGHVSASSSAATKQLYVKCCEVPLHQWNLLRHLPCLTHVNITDCSGLTWSSTDLLQCISSLETLFVVDCKNSTVALPERLGELTSLKRLVLRDCNGITSLPESIQQLTCLHRLEINGCPGLVQWCKSEENKMKLAHIEEIVRALPIYIHLLFYVFTGYSFRHLSIYRVYSQLHILEVFRSCSNVYIIIHCPSFFSRGKGCPPLFYKQKCNT